MDEDLSSLAIGETSRKVREYSNEHTRHVIERLRESKVPFILNEELVEYNGKQLLVIRQEISTSDPITYVFGYVIEPAQIQSGEDTLRARRTRIALVCDEELGGIATFLRKQGFRGDFSFSR